MGNSSGRHTLIPRQTFSWTQSMIFGLETDETTWYLDTSPFLTVTKNSHAAELDQTSFTGQTHTMYQETAASAATRMRSYIVSHVPIRFCSSTTAPSRLTTMWSRVDASEIV